MKLAAVLICKASDEEAKVLDVCLESLSKAADGIFLTVTGKNAACEEVGRKYGAVISTVEWTGDFSEARNFALAQVPKDYDYWMWADADDAVRGIERLRDTIEAHPECDAFVFNYLYAFDKWKNPVVVHMKTRVLRNDGCVEWRGALHEDFHAFRELNSKMVEDIEWIHLSDETRHRDSQKRNVAIASRQAKADPSDPRTYWNLGNALKADGKDAKALAAFRKFMATSKSEEEKYIVLVRISEIYVSMGRLADALDSIRMAIGTRPSYPDAHIASARILMSMRRNQEAKEAVMMGLQLPPPYHKAIVFNPRDYDLEPLRLLAEIYLALGTPQLSLEALRACARITPKDEDLQRLIVRMESEARRSDEVVALVERLKDLPDDELRAGIEAVEPEYRSHPALTHLRNTRLVKRESSGRDVVFYCGFTEEEWTPETARTRGIGGSEEAVIHLSRRMAERGLNVTVYNNCGHMRQAFDGVEYRPFWEWNYRDRQDAVIVWRSPRALDYEINSDTVILDMHDVVGTGEFTEERIARVRKVMFKSKCHRDLYPQVPEEKCGIVQNGIVWDQFQEEAEKDPDLIINTSSPDRSLKTLLRAFSRVREAVPTARLQWAYGWGVWDSVFAGDAERTEWKDEVIALAEATPGVEMLGRVSHGEVAGMYRRASVFAYPTAFYEIDCISARKAQAGGAWPVVTDFAALDETVAFGTKVHADPDRENWGKPYKFDFGLQEERAVDEWVGACIDALKNPPSAERVAGMREWTRKFDWEAVTDAWMEVI